MPELIANARMYAVTPAIESRWQALLARIADDAGVALAYVPYPAPQPLEALWARRDLGCVFMCGYPIALKLADVRPLAAPVPRAPWASGRAVYRSDLIVREDAPFRSLEDTFGGRSAWTVEHSHSGFNAFRHHLLAYRSASRPVLYREMLGPLVTARKVLDAVRERRIDVGPLDAYWHLLIARHSPALTEGVRILTSTATAPMPAFVAAAGSPADALARLREAFSVAATRPWFAEFGDELLLDGFRVAERSDYAPTLAWAREAESQGYPRPA